MGTVMCKKIVISLLILAAVTIAFGLNEANAAFSAQVGSPNLSFSISDYQPAPPNVYVQNDGGRPYYMERDRRVYMEKKKHGKNHKNGKKHHKDNGRNHSHEGHNSHD